MKQYINFILCYLETGQLDKSLVRISGTSYENKFNAVVKYHTSYIAK